eukprot:TRINITY_DN1423_c0_g2_i1.p1 TRINITY_DN1423_c0_g2~~TRINITY_DN1423_c0_g2_i1.p1  ORF type:complete len:300 (+),score=40.66 TRINITY_DN1423_c0_g2_i1:55-900(+)
MRWLILTTVLIALYNRKRAKRAVYRLKYSQAEWKARVELAALYRIAAARGWDEVIYNHITLRVPGEEALLINGFGLKYEEVTASNLVKIDFDGNVLDSGSRNMSYINVAGLVIHTAVHRARPDVHCVLHHHSPNSIVVSSTTDKFVPFTQMGAVIHPLVSPTSHPYEGIAVEPAEQARIVSALSDYTILLMENHGCLIAHKTVASTYWISEMFERACNHQVELLKATGGDASKIIPIPASVVSATAARAKKFSEAVRTTEDHFGKREFEAVLRNMPKDYDN